jgi:hypothetical protein
VEYRLLLREKTQAKFDSLFPSLSDEL